jgi:hypothetical protein
MASSRFCYIFFAFRIQISTQTLATLYESFMVSSAPRIKHRDGFSMYITFIPFGILSKSLFTYGLNIRRYIARDIEGFIKNITNQ